MMNSEAIQSTTEITESTEKAAAYREALLKIRAELVARLNGLRNERLDVLRRLKAIDVLLEEAKA